MVHAIDRFFSNAVGQSSCQLLTVKVKPRSSCGEVVGQRPDGVWQVRLKSAPVDNAANAELIDLLADHFDVPKSNVAIRSGRNARLKVVEIRSQASM